MQNAWTQWPRQGLGENVFPVTREHPVANAFQALGHMFLSQRVRAVDLASELAQSFGFVGHLVITTQDFALSDCAG